MSLSRLKVTEAALKWACGNTLVNGVDIAYVKVGTGKRAVLLIPGGLGSAFSDFGPQLKMINRDKFTVVSWDPRGYGRSIPPKRDYPVDFIKRDAEDAAGLMHNLGLSSYSILGWSDGGNVACVLAAKYPDRVGRLVIWGANAYVTQHDIDGVESVGDISLWSESMKQPMLEMYGKDYFQSMLTKWVAVFQRIFNERGGELYAGDLPRIKCPTLVIHGMKDTICPLFHAKFLHENIKNSVAEYWQDAKHNLHLRYPEKFNARVEEFLLQ